MIQCNYIKSENVENNDEEIYGIGSGKVGMV